MRTAEWIQIVFAAALAAAAWVQGWWARRPLPLRTRGWITLLGVIPLVAVLLARASGHFLPRWYVSVGRDWLTVALFLVPYWQTGQFFQGQNPRLQQKLMAMDRWLLPGLAARSGTAQTGIGTALEIAYLFCYPFVPLGLLALYVVGQPYHAGGFWLVVLIATYLCYGITPFVPAYPPRDMALDKAAKTPVGRVRGFNRWILQYGSIHAISFPSAHVASCFAVSLVMLYYAPVVGGVFLLVAIGIALGAVVGRYHYVLDVVAGAVTALLVFAACYPFL